MTSTTNTADRTSTGSYLERLRGLSYIDLLAEKAEIESKLSGPATTIDGATIRRLVPSDASLFANHGEINYVIQERDREADRSATAGVSEGAGENPEACAKL
jgi:hypothetical protein